MSKFELIVHSGFDLDSGLNLQRLDVRIWSSDLNQRPHEVIGVTVKQDQTLAGLAAALRSLADGLDVPDSVSFVESSASDAELVAAASDELRQRASVDSDGKAN